MNRCTLTNELWCSKRSWTYLQVLFELLFCLTQFFKYGDGANFWGYVGINAEPLCVEFCNFVQCHIFVNY
jgi:hypothetical protein